MNPLRGIGLKVLSVSVFTLMAVCIKAAGAAGAAGRGGVLPVVLRDPGDRGLAGRRRDNLRHGLDTGNPMGHLWRGLVGTTAMGLGFTALGLLPLPEVTALGYAAPLLTVIFAAMFLGEQVRAFRLTAVALGLVGVVIVLSPRLTITNVEVASQAADHRRDGGAARRGVRGAGAGLRAQAGAGRADRRRSCSTSR